MPRDPPLRLPLAASPGPFLAPGGRAEPISILVSDLRGFTALGAAMPPDDLVQVLGEMFGMFNPIIFKYDGAVGGSLGDSLLAVPGTPEPDDRRWEKAVRAALGIQRAMAKRGEARRGRGLPARQAGIGTQRGELVHGKHAEREGELAGYALTALRGSAG